MCTKTHPNIFENGYFLINNDLEKHKHVKGKEIMFRRFGDLRRHYQGMEINASSKAAL